MSNENLKTILGDFFKFFQYKVQELNFPSDNSLPVVQFTGKNGAVKGLRNVVSEISKPENTEHDAVQDQWVEYIQTHLSNLNVLDMLKDVNEYLLENMYFVGHEIGPVDILMYYILFNVYSNFSFYEKEKYMNASRWFNSVQQYKNARLGRPMVTFSRCCLYT